MYYAATGSAVGADFSPRIATFTADRGSISTSGTSEEYMWGHAPGAANHEPCVAVDWSGDLSCWDTGITVTGIANFQLWSWDYNSYLPYYQGFQCGSVDPALAFGAYSLMGTPALEEYYWHVPIYENATYYGNSNTISLCFDGWPSFIQGTQYELRLYPREPNLPIPSFEGSVTLQPIGPSDYQYVGGEDFILQGEEVILMNNYYPGNFNDASNMTSNIHFFGDVRSKLGDIRLVVEKGFEFKGVNMYYESNATYDGVQGVTSYTATNCWNVWYQNNPPVSTQSVKYTYHLV